MSREEFEIQVRIHLPALLAWTSRKVPDPDLAKDLVQDAFLAAYQQLGQFKEESSFKTWITGILKFKIADFYRKAVRQPVGEWKTEVFFDQTGNWVESEEPGEWGDDRSLFDQLSFREVWESCLGKLPVQWHQAVNGKYLEEKDSKKICQDLGISTTNYWQLLHRAKLQLRKCLEMNWFNA